MNALLVSVCCVKINTVIMAPFRGIMTIGLSASCVDKTLDRIFHLGSQPVVGF
jgi:hypothetical protein